MKSELEQAPGKPTVLVVDDIPENIDVLGGVLRAHYRVKAAPDGKRALRIARSGQRPDLILLDIMMPEMDGYQVCRELKRDPRTRGIPVIFVTARSDVEDETYGLELGAADYLTKPVNPAVVLSRVRTQLALYDQNRQLERMVNERTAELSSTRLEIIRRLSRAAELKDSETGMHVIRMGHYSRLIAEALGRADSWCDLLFNAAPMHDIGKIGIPDSILCKRGRLTEEEWLIMHQHPAYGAEIIGDHHSELMQMSREIALCHHENWDGSGYPNGSRGSEIGMAARIVSIADVFDALTSVRPYKEAWTVQAAVDYIDQQRGRRFDPGLVPVFRSCLTRVLDIQHRYGETSGAAVPP